VGSVLSTIRDKRQASQNRKTANERLADVLFDLQTVHEIEDVASMPGGARLMAVLRGRILSLQDEINSFARDPIANEKAMVWAAARRDAYQGLVDLVETTLDWKPELIADKKRYEANADLEKRRSAKE